VARKENVVQEWIRKDAEDLVRELAGKTGFKSSEIRNLALVAGLLELVQRFETTNLHRGWYSDVYKSLYAKARAKIAMLPEVKARRYIKVTSIKFPVDLYSELNEYAGIVGKPLAVIVKTAVRKYLEECRPVKTKRLVLHGKCG